MKFSKWFDAVQHCEQNGQSYVIATVLGAAGSIPRDQGSKMVITEDDDFDSLGGGHLEFSVMNKAREMMANGQAGNHIEHFPLGASLGQCCGGSVTVLMESFVHQSLNLTVFGAGHVAKALMNILAGLPAQVRWVDSRADQFPTEVSKNIKKCIEEFPVDIINTLPKGSQILILTHNHQLDFELVEAALKREDFSFIGCIGSQTKAERFQMRLRHKNFTQQQIDSVICPVGLLDIPGKLPMEVAVSMAAQLIAFQHQGEQKELRQGISWKDIKKQIQSSDISLVTGK
ncbi:MAG: xanthine dehydrogenase accessory factor [Crocinitomicaceae bacterium]|jgi:xanthine dehydrogenase accessory factor